MFLLCVIFKSVRYARHFEFRLSTPASDVHVQPKTTGTAIKIAKETANDQRNKCNSVKRLQRTQFSFMKTSIEIKVSLKILSHVSIII